MKCRWCRYFERCRSFMNHLTGDETECDFIPSRFRVRGYPYSRKMTNDERKAEHK